MCHEAGLLIDSRYTLFRETHDLELILTGSPRPGGIADAATSHKRRSMQHTSDSPTAVRLKQQLSQAHAQSEERDAQLIECKSTAADREARYFGWEVTRSLLPGFLTSPNGS